MPINRPDAEDGLRKQEMSRLALPCQKPVSSRTRRPQRRTANAGAAAPHPGCSERTASPAPTGNRANSESYCFEQRSRTAILVLSDINIWSRQFFKGIVRCWLVFVLALTAIFWVLYQAEKNARVDLTRTREETLIQLANRELSAELTTLHNDTLFLADHSGLHQWLGSGDPAGLASFTADLRAFVRRSELFDQARFLDEHGQEVVRINWNAGNPEAVPADALQDKSDRYYVKAILGEKKGGVYFSPLDLNIENGAVEHPLKPMIRIGTPVFDSAGHKRGLIVLNYLAERLLNQLRALGKQRPGQLWLLNDRGYWLLGPRPDLEWGFMFPGHEATRVDDHYGELWQLINSQQPQAQRMLAQGLFTYTWANGMPWAFKERWVLVSHVPTETLATSMSVDTRNLGITFIVLVLLLTGISGAFSYGGLALGQMRKRYRELVNNLPVGVYRLDPGGDGRFLEVNPAMVSLFEAESSEALLRQPISALYCSTGERAAFNDKILKQGFVSGEAAHLQTVKGRRFEAAITAAARRDARGNSFFDGIVEDVSESKEKERRIQRLNDRLRIRTAQLERVNRELEAFSYSVSHDLRAPLRAIDGFSRALLDDHAQQLDDTGRDYLNRVCIAAGNMAALINDLLKLARISRSDLQRESIDLSAIAEEVVASLRQDDPQRSLAFSAQPGLRANGDPLLLRIVMENLLGNAWKFTGKRADASIGVGSVREGAETIYFVRDNGAGFDMDYKDKLFGAFQRLHDANEFPGSGIGLATVERIVHRHGGRIWAESVAGKGSTFYFTLGEAENNDVSADKR